MGPRTSYCWTLVTSRCEILTNSHSKSLHLAELLLDGGSVTLFNLHQMSSLSRKHLPQLSVTSSNIEDIMSRAYDSFEIQLNSLQLLYSKPGTVSKAAVRLESLVTVGCSLLDARKQTVER